MTPRRAQDMVKNALKVLSKSGEGFTQTDGAGQISIKPGQEEALAAWASALEEFRCGLDVSDLVRRFPLSC